jgi:glycosyltransferase involved in cell wall biosynthesis
MKKKILLLSDDMRMTSGIAVMSSEIVLGTVDRYDWVQLGAAIKHPELGKIVDVSEDVRKISGVPDANVKIIPNNGYGDIFKLRHLIKEEKPDAILHFTDPHYWQWLYDMEHEVRQTTPLLFYHIWDDIPDPQYNRNYYESCDWIGCISKQTYGIVNRVGKRKDSNTFKPLEDWQISYVPHGINKDVFKPIELTESSLYNELNIKDRYDFILFYNNRNIRRKQPADVMYGFQLFCEKIGKEKSSRCLLIMRTSPVDENGTDLNAIRKDLCPDVNVIFINQIISREKLNELYNIADCTINISNNEGFGLSTAESLMAGTPIIVNVTGGLQDQCGFTINGQELTSDDYVNLKSLNFKKQWQDKVKHGDWVVPVWPVSNLLNGSVPTPYIFDDRINHDDLVDGLTIVYDWGRLERKRRGLIGREWAIKNISSKIMCNSMSFGIDNAIKNFKPREKYNLYKIV